VPIDPLVDSCERVPVNYIVISVETSSAWRSISASRHRGSPRIRKNGSGTPSPISQLAMSKLRECPMQPPRGRSCYMYASHPSFTGMHRHGNSSGHNPVRRFAARRETTIAFRRSQIYERLTGHVRSVKFVSSRQDFFRTHTVNQTRCQAYSKSSATRLHRMGCQSFSKVRNPCWSNAKCPGSSLGGWSE